MLTPITNDLFGEAGRDFFDDFFNKGRFPALNNGVHHTVEDGKLSISFDVPGLATDELEAEIVKNIVTVKGKKDGRDYFYRVQVRNVDTDSAKHTHENGVLTLTFDEAAEIRPRNLLASGKKK